MKTAFLILAHDQPFHLSKLVNYLSCDWTRIFIHIDRMVNIAEFRKCIPEQGEISFLNGNDRISVNWGGFSQIRASLNLLDASLNSGEHFDRFCLLTGSDFPIKALEKIKVSFDSDKEFMRIDRRLDGTENGTYHKMVMYLHYLDSPFPKLTGRFLKIPRKVYGRIGLYMGSAYWSLTKGCISYITEFLQRDKGYTTFHEHTKSPDEIFFHSIVKSSPFAAKITHDFERANDLNEYYSLNEHGCHYIDWNTKGINRPRILDESDLNNLLDSEALFARKFREGESDHLLQMIEETIGK